MRPRWPKEVPILTAKDICRHRLSDDGGAHCLVGWKESVFGKWSIVSNPMHKKVWESINTATGRQMPSRFNDDHNNSLRDIARVWNRAMALLGYVCGNPEAKWAEQHKRKARKA